MGGPLIQSWELYEEHLATKCALGDATNPIVVTGDHTAPFGMCAIAKVACTNWRTLLRAVMMHPELPAPDVIKDNWSERPGAFHTVHTDVYSTLWQYELQGVPSSEAFPFFKIGRNPCVLLPRQPVLSSRADL